MKTMKYASGTQASPRQVNPRDTRMRAAAAFHDRCVGDDPDLPT